MRKRYAFFLIVSCALLMVLASTFRVPKASARGQQNTPTFHAKGTHTCQSKTSIGHECVVEGDFNDCDEAYHKLKMQDCCSSTKEGGATSGFVLNYCYPK
jgi:hypothetical protein